jgi:predicted nucleotidyltransferase
MSHEVNLARIKAVHIALGDLQNEVVFVGGSTVSLYADQHGFEFRGTDDVDVIIEIANYPQHVGFEARVREKGFADDVESPVRGRFKLGDITVDLIPTRNILMGFENIWYPDGFKNAMPYAVDEDITVRILSSPYLLATKLEAFKSRGRNDGRTSQDFEDIVYVLENRAAIWDECRAADEQVREYLRVEFKGLLSQKYIYEWIDCHVDFDSPPSTVFILEEAKSFVAG